MHTVSESAAHDSRLRFVFSDTVVSFRVAADVTLGEIASRCGEVSDRLTSHPIAVDVTIGVPGYDQSRSVVPGPAAAVVLARWPDQP